MVLSYSFRDEILRARLSLMRASRSVRMRRSFWILAARVQEHSGFSSMQKLNGRSAPDRHGRGFYRKGEIGDWCAGMAPSLTPRKNLDDEPAQGCPSLS